MWCSLEKFSDISVRTNMGICSVVFSRLLWVRCVHFLVSDSKNINFSDGSADKKSPLLPTSYAICSLFPSSCFFLPSLEGETTWWWALNRFNIPNSVKAYTQNVIAVRWNVKKALFVLFGKSAVNAFISRNLLVVDLFNIPSDSTKTLC